ncbi:sodium:solute symporter [Clostridia bacterium]|nr:sodium:solute symporter [Clostridia bacterium]
MDWLNYLVLGAFVAGMAAIAYFTRKRSKSTDDFLLGNRGVTAWMSAFAYGTTYFSAVIFIGYAGSGGKEFGLAAVWIGAGNAVIGALCAWLLFAKRARTQSHALGARTIPEFFEKKFDSKYIKLVAGCLIFVFLIPYSASVYNGLGYLFEIVFGIPLWCVILLMAALTAAYVFSGGYTATVVSDFVQGLVMLAGVAVMAVFVFRAPEIGGFAEAVRRLSEAGKSLIPSGPVFWNLFFMIMLTSLGSWGMPQMAHKFFAVKNERGTVLRAATVCAAFALIVGGGAYLVGTVVGVANPPLAETGDRMIPELLSRTLPAGLMGLIAVLVLSASMSTLSGLSLTGSGAVAIDVYKGYIKKQADDKKINFLTRMLTLVFIAVSAALALINSYTGVTTIVTLMSLSWGLLGGALVGPFALGLWFKGINKYGAYASIVSSCLITLVLFIIMKTVPSAAVVKPPFIGTMCLLASFPVTAAASWIGGKVKGSKDKGQGKEDTAAEVLL